LIGGVLVLGKSLRIMYQWCGGCDFKSLFKGDTVMIGLACFRSKMCGSPRRARGRPRHRVEEYFLT